MKIDKTLIAACLAGATVGIIIGMMIDPADREKVQSTLLGIGEDLLAGGVAKGNEPE
jgi:hypothetical protein